MGMIKFASMEYFTLLKLQSELRAFDFDRLDLINLDRLRDEIDIKVESINRLHDGINITKKN